MPDWLSTVLKDQGLWRSSQAPAVSLIVTGRFEVYLIRRVRQEWPTLVGKIARDPSSNQLLAREHRFLTKRACELGESASEFMPRSFGAFDVPGRQVIWIQSGQPGQQVLPVLDHAVFGRVGSWLSRLGTTGVSSPLRMPEMYLSECPGAGSTKREKLAYEAARQLAGRITAVWEHGDLNPTNILVHGDQVGAVDWVWAQTRGKPLFDWFDFCIHMTAQSLANRSVATLATWQSLVGLLADPRSELNRLIGSGVTQISESLDIAPADRLSLRTLYFTTRFWSILEHNYPHEAEPLALRALGG